MKHPVRYRAEYVLLRAFATLLQRLPYRAALGVAWALAALSFPILVPRVREAKRRLREVFGTELSAAERQRIAWISWRNMAFNCVEMLRMSGMTREWVASVSDCQRAAQVLGAHAATGRGCIIAVPHTGSWELAGMSCKVFGIPVFTVSGLQSNPLVNEYMRTLRERTAIPTLERGSGVLRGVLRHLRSGEALAIMPDVRTRTRDLDVLFLGGRANLPSGMGLFAYQADVPIFPCVPTRQGWARHRVEIFDPVYPNKSADRGSDTLRMTREVLAVFDAAVRRDPSQWFWFNRRWVLDLLDDEPSQNNADVNSGDLEP